MCVCVFAQNMSLNLLGIDVVVCSMCVVGVQWNEEQCSSNVVYPTAADNNMLLVLCTNNMLLLMSCLPCF